MKINNRFRHCEPRRGEAISGKEDCFVAIAPRNDKMFLFFFFLLTAVSCQLSVLCFSQEDNTAKANEHFLAGNKLLEAGNYADADAEFKKAQDLLKAQPRVLPAPAKETSPAPVKAERRKTQPELNIPPEMTPEEAVSFYRRATENLPRNPSLHYNLAIAYLRTKQYPLAAEAFKKAVQLNSKDKESYYNLGVLYENHLGNKKQALFYYGRYLKLSPLAEDSQKVRLWMLQIKEEFKLNE